MDRKEELMQRVEAALKDNYKTKDNTQKKIKCSNCGTTFHGRAGASTCGDKCRQQRSRG